MKEKFWKKFVSFLLSLSLLANSVSAPLLVLAQEETPNPEPTPEETSSPSPEPTVAPSEEPSTSAEVSPSPEVTVEPEETATPTPEESLSPSLSPSSEPTVEGTTNENAQPQAPPTDSPEPIFNITNTITYPVVQGTTYTLPETLVSITFNKVTELGFVTLTELKLTPEQVAEVNAVNDTAYEITSTLTDGTFEYDLTLPKPQDKSTEELDVKFAETEEDIGSAQTVTESTEQTAETITIRGLTHFTVFVLVNDVDTDNPDDLGDSDDVANGTFSVISDAFADEKASEDDDDHNTNELHVRTKEDQNKRTFVVFDATPVDGDSEVTKATLRLFLFDAPTASRTYGSYRITAFWDEDTLTWNNQPSTTWDDATGGTSSTGTTNNVWIEWDVTADVQGFIDEEITNYGWMISDTSEDESSARLGKFRSSSASNELRRPQLVVDFAAPDEQPTEYNSPTDSVNDTGGDGDGFESNPVNAHNDGGGVASNTNGAGDRHVFRTYFFEIPTDAVINGIEVRTDWYLDSDVGTNSLDVELSSDGGASWTDAKSDITETDKEHVASLGGANDTWGREWVAGEFANENFKVRVTTSSTNSSRDFFLDWIPVRVYYTEQEEDETPPVSEFSTPNDNDVTNEPIYISGSSTDVPDTTVQTVNVYAQLSGNIDWGDPILTFENEGGDEPFNWADYWTPGEDGDYDFKVSAMDDSGNIEESDYVYNVVYDTTDPTSEITFPEDPEDEDGVTYTEDSWNEVGEIQGTAVDEPSSGVSTVYVSIQRDSDGAYWDGEEEVWGNEEEEEYLNEADFDGGEWFYVFEFIEPEGGDEGYTARSHAEDNAGNLEETNEVHFYFSAGDTEGPVISDISVTPDPTNSPPSISAIATDSLNTIASAIYAVDDSEFSSSKALEAEDGSFDSTSETIVGGSDMDYPGEGLHTLYVGAYDAVGNFGSASTQFSVDTLTPTSEFISPDEGFTTNSPIEISGSSSDESLDTVDYVQLFYRESVGEEEEENEWSEIDTDSENEGTQPLQNSEGNEPFEWSFTWTPPSDGTFDIKAEATDTAGNTESSPQVDDITYDATNPAGDWEAPEADTDVNGTVALEVSASDDNSGVNEVEFLYKRNDGIDTFHSIATDDTNTYSTDWDTTGLALDDYILRAIIRDNAANETTIHQTNGVSAVVSNESGASSSYGQATITWTTDRPTSSRVVYDTVSHPTPGAAPNYGYASSTGTSDTSPKVTSHSVTITGLSNGTTYYYRTVSEGSPTTVGDEKSFQTLSTAGGPGPSAGGGGATAGTTLGAATFFGPVLAFATNVPESEEVVLGEETEETVSPSPEPRVEGAESPDRSWLWWLLAVAVLGAGYYYYRSRKAK